MDTPQYIHLAPGASVADASIMAPFAAVVTIDAKVTSEWRRKVSEWLVETGCLYMMAQGDDCTLWDDSVDWANIDAYDFEGIPEDKSVMTSWHEDENLQEVFYFALTSVHFYPLIKYMVILDVSEKSREPEIINNFKAAQDEIEQDRIKDRAEKFPPEPIIKNFFKWILNGF